MHDESMSVSDWMEGLKAGSPEAAAEIWKKYVAKLTSHIQRRLQRYGIRRVEADDVLVDVFDSLCRGAQKGRFPRLDDQHDLWQVLVMLTRNKVVDQVRRKRLPSTESAIGNLQDGHSGSPPLDCVIDNEPTPEFAAEVADELERRFGLLSAEQLDKLGLRQLGGRRGEDLAGFLRALALRKLEGLTNQEISEMYEVGPRNVERALRLIRRIWMEFHQTEPLS